MRKLIVLLLVCFISVPVFAQKGGAPFFAPVVKYTGFGVEAGNSILMGGRVGWLFNVGDYDKIGLGIAGYALPSRNEYNTRDKWALPRMYNSTDLRTYFQYDFGFYYIGGEVSYRTSAQNLENVSMGFNLFVGGGVVDLGGGKVDLKGIDKVAAENLGYVVDSSALQGALMKEGVLVFEPSVNLLFKVSEPVQLGLEVGYRLVTGAHFHNDLVRLWNNKLGGFTAGVTMQFGLSK